MIPSIFTQHSHGFRPGRSCHTALHEVDFVWRPVTWLVSCDISKAFDKLNHRILLRHLEKYIKDQRVINELWKMLKIKVLDFQLHTTPDKTLGVPQGSVLSPFLFNVYMHGLDKLALELMTKIRREAINKANPAYIKLKHDYMKEYGDVPWEARHKRLRKLATEARKRGINSRIKNEDTMSIKMFYIRYADDILIGFHCSKELAKKQLDTINNYIKSNLQLKVKSMELVHAPSGKVDFLGFTLTQWTESASRRVPGKALASFKRAKARVKSRISDESQWYWKMVEQAGKTIY